MGILRHRWVVLLCLLVAGVAVRSLRAWQEPVVNPDTIRFIGQAQELALHPLQAVRDEPYHPLHSLAGLGVHGVMGRWGGDERMAWIGAMQIVGIVAGAVVSPLIFLLARRLGAPAWSALFAAVLWIVGRRTSAYGADGLSDMLFLALFAGAMLVAMPALPPVRRGVRWPWWRLGVSGGLFGLAYLTRPEGLAGPLILVMAMVLTALRHRRIRWVPKLPGRIRDWLRPNERAFKVRPRARTSWWHVLMGASLLTGGMVAVALPYMIMIGGITQKKDLMVLVPQGPQMEASLLPGVLADPWAWGKIGMELWETFGFAPFLINVLALLWRPYLWGRARYRLLVILWAGLWLMVMLWLIGITPRSNPAAYLDGRHTLPLQLVAHCWFALALPIWAKPMRWWQGFWRRRAVWARMPAWMTWGRWPTVFAVMVGCLGLLPGLIMLREPPFADRAFIREGARWVAEHYPPKTKVVSTDQRVGYYAGVECERRAGMLPRPDFPDVVYRYDGPVLAAYVFQTKKEGEGPEEFVAGVNAVFRRVKTFAAVGSVYDDKLVIYELDPNWRKSIKEKK